MEFNAFSIRDMKTLTYYNLDIYRYLIGRDAQTISREYWKKKYKDHEYIIFNILHKVHNDKKYTKEKIKYVLKNIISPMVDSQIFMFDTICKWNEIEKFLDKLKQYDDAYNCSMSYIEKLDGNSWLILNCYKNKIGTHNKNPIVIPGIRESMSDIIFSKQNLNIKNLLKAVTPYGLIHLRRKYVNKNKK